MRLVVAMVVGIVQMGMPAFAAQPLDVVDGPVVVLDLPWGSSGPAVGRRDAEESAPEGPMSFAVGPDGELYVLDQVNQRVLKFTPEGELDLEITLPAMTFQDLEIAPDGALVVVDRLVRRSILVLDEAGNPLGEYAYEGEAIPEGGGITATFARSDGVWLEFAHTWVARILDEQYRPCVEEIVPGRIMADGKTRVVAARDGAGGADVWLEAYGGDEPLVRTTVEPAEYLDRIIWIEGDDMGHIVVAMHLFPRDGHALARAGSDFVSALVLGEDLQVLGSFRSPYAIVEWEQFREFKVMPGGSVYQMALTRGGMRILRWSLR